MRNEIGRDYSSRIAVKMTRSRKVCLWIMIGLAAIGISHAVIEPWIDRSNEETRSWLAKDISAVAAPRAEADEMDRLDIKIQDMKNEVLDALSKCESGGKSDIAIVFDTNAKPSVGIFQWQPQSFQHYHQKRTGQKISEREAIVMALDNAKARDLASWVIFESGSGVSKDWVNCSKWHGLQAKVDLIKTLSQ